MEEWKDIPNYEGLYQVSSYGRVKSLSRYRRIGARFNLIPERILKHGLSRGYPRVVLTKNGEKKSLSIHRLVALTFIPTNDLTLQVNHIDENKLNNNVDNLEWVTCKENINWGTSLKKRALHQRISQPNHKEVIQFDKQGKIVNKYYSCKEAARQNNIHKSGIQHCCNGDPKFPTYKGYIWRYQEAL